MRKIEITEVGLRDGLQNEAAFFPTADKIAMANRLIAAGIRRLEATSFVSPRAVPQLADAEELIAGIDRVDGLTLEALVPNARGGERAAGVDIWVTFMSASETHSEANSNCPMDEAFNRIRPLPNLAAQSGATVSAALAVAFDCPFEGATPPERVVDLAKRFRDIGVATLKLGDTIGTASPGRVKRLVELVRAATPELELVLHFHDTRGLGLANIMAGMEVGVTRFEASIGGLGGCPFAPGATGNVSTEDVAHLLQLEGVETGINLTALIAAGTEMAALLGRVLPASLQKATPVGSRYAFDETLRAVG